MRRIANWLQRLPFGALTRRAFGETFADWRHESRGVGVPGRARATIGALAGLLRVAGRAFGSFEEHPMRNMGRDVRHGLRRLRATPLYAVFAVVTLGLGIGATTAVYSLVHAVVGPPSGVRDVDRIINVYHARPGGNPATSGMSWPDFQDFRAAQTSFGTVTGWTRFGGAFVAEGGSTSASAEVVDGHFFGVLGVEPQLGRLLQPGDDRPEAPLVAVISHGTWQHLYAGRPDVVGRVIRVNGYPFEIIGVAPRAFRGTFNNGLIPSAAWMPVGSVRVLAGPGQRMSLDAGDRDNRWLMVKGVLAPDATFERAEAEVARIGAQLDAVHPIGRDLEPAFASSVGTRRQWTIRRMAEMPLDSDAEIVNALAAALMLAVGVVLLVACTNLANLTLARSTARRHEQAVRLALGASRWRLVRESLVESVVVAAAGGVAGLGVARVIMASVSREVAIAGTPATLFIEPRLDGAVLAAALVATLLALAVSGVGPALQSARAGLRATLASEGGGAAPRWRGRRYLIVTQVTVSVVLLALAAIAVTRLRDEAGHDPRFDRDRLALAEVRFDSQGYDTPRARQVLEAARGLLAGQDEVEAVSIASGLQSVTTVGRTTVSVPDRPAPAVADLVGATPDVFDTLGVSFVHGGGWTQGGSTEPVVVLSAWTARQLFGESNVVGRTVMVSRRLDGTDELVAEPHRVIGIASDTDVAFYGYGEPDRPLVYLPIERVPLRSAVLIARTDGDPAALVPALRRALAGADPGLAVHQAGAATYLAGATTLFFGIVAGIASLLGSFAWLLALVGLYGVLTHVVHRRTREIGLRVALGARRGQIIRMVIRDGLDPVLLGIIAGLALGIVVRMAMPGSLQGLVPVVDLVGLALVPVLFVGAAGLACYLPARRAARVDPNVALRDL